MAMVNKIASMSPPTIKKQIQVFLGAVGFWRVHIPELSQIESPLYLMMQKMNYFKWGPEKQASEQIKKEIVHAIALGSVRTGQDVKTVLYTTAGENGPSWSLCQKVPGDTGG